MGTKIWVKPPSPPFWPRVTKINRVHPLTSDYNYGDLQLISSTRSWVRVWRPKYGSSPFTSPPFDPGSPKFLEYTPLPVTIIVVIYNLSAQSVYELECGTKMRVKPPCSPPFWSMALKNNRAHLQTIVILCADNGLSSTVIFLVIARTRNLRGEGGLVLIPPHERIDLLGSD